VGLTRQNYYARHSGRQRRQIDAGLVAELVVQERQVQPRLGTRKLHWRLQGPLAALGVKLGRDRMFETLRARGLLVPRRRARHPCTTQTRHALPVFTNLVKELAVRRPNEVWVSDLTYLRTREGYLYVSLITDRHSRKIVGYHAADTLAASGCGAALAMALADLPAEAHPIHHSDRGSQYCCHEYAGQLQARGLPISMTETDHCAENALAERMNGILKGEYGLDQEFGTKQQGRHGVRQAVYLYNHLRPHTALGYQYPHQAHLGQVLARPGLPGCGRPPTGSLKHDPSRDLGVGSPARVGSIPVGDRPQPGRKTPPVN
jgi:transposase InsO family protein